MRELAFYNIQKKTAQKNILSIFTVEIFGRKFMKNDEKSL